MTNTSDHTLRGEEKAASNPLQSKVNNEYERTHMAEPLVDMNYAQGGLVSKHPPVPNQSFKSGHYVKDGILHSPEGNPIAYQDGAIMRPMAMHPHERTPHLFSGGLAHPQMNASNYANGGAVALDPRQPGYATGGPVDFTQNGQAGNLPQISDSLAKGGMPLNRTGFVNRDIPYSKGGMVNSMDNMPPDQSVEFKAQGGLLSPNQTLVSEKGFADGGPVPDQNAQTTQPQVTPQDQQAMQNQQIAEQAVPKESTADTVPARLSKGEFVMDAPTVMYWGVGKFQKMQEQAHTAIAKHMAKQDAQQAQSQQQQAQPQAQHQGLAAPQQPMPQQMPPQAANPPDATQQRIAQTANPPPAPKPNPSPFSLMG